MCQIVDYHNERLETQADLKRALGLDKLPCCGIYVKEGSPEFSEEDDSCLCSIDIEIAAEMAGKKAFKTNFENTIAEWEIKDVET